jgi:hypothetical protein
MTLLATQAPLAKLDALLNMDAMPERETLQSRPIEGFTYRIECSVKLNPSRFKRPFLATPH